MFKGVVHKAVRKAERFVGRCVYVVRDALGKIHNWLYIRPHSGRVLCLVAVRSDGSRVVIRHV